MRTSESEHPGQSLVEQFYGRVEVLLELLHPVLDDVALAEFVDESVRVAVLPRKLCQFVVRDNEVALPLGVGRVGLGQTLPDAERLAEQPLAVSNFVAFVCFWCKFGS